MSIFSYMNSKRGAGARYVTLLLIFTLAWFAVTENALTSAVLMFFVSGILLADGFMILVPLLFFISPSAIYEFLYSSLHLFDVSFLLIAATMVLLFAVAARAIVKYRRAIALVLKEGVDTRRVTVSFISLCIALSFAAVALVPFYVLVTGQEGLCAILFAVQRPENFVFLALFTALSFALARTMRFCRFDILMIGAIAASLLLPFIGKYIIVSQVRGAVDPENPAIAEIVDAARDNVAYCSRNNTPGPESESAFNSLMLDTFAGKINASIKTFSISIFSQAVDRALETGMGNCKDYSAIFASLVIATGGRRDETWFVVIPAHIFVVGKYHDLYYYYFAGSGLYPVSFSSYDDFYSCFSGALNERSVLFATDLNGRVTGLREALDALRHAELEASE